VAGLAWPPAADLFHPTPLTKVAPVAAEALKQLLGLAGGGKKLCEGRAAGMRSHTRGRASQAAAHVPAAVSGVVSLYSNCEEAYRPALVQRVLLGGERLLVPLLATADGAQGGSNAGAADLATVAGPVAGASRDGGGQGEAEAGVQRAAGPGRRAGQPAGGASAALDALGIAVLQSLALASSAAGRTAALEVLRALPPPSPRMLAALAAMVQVDGWFLRGVLRQLQRAGRRVRGLVLLEPCAAGMMRLLSRKGGGGEAGTTDLERAAEQSPPAI
jgi:hypothetical protein